VSARPRAAANAGPGKTEDKSWSFEGATTNCDTVSDSAAVPPLFAPLPARDQPIRSSTEMCISESHSRSDPHRTSW
jgi:hypothetical protein